MARNKLKYSITRDFHRWIGAGASLFILFMTLSGLAINHSQGLSLDKKQVSHSTLLGWYGLNAPESVRSFAVADDWLSFAGSQLYFNDQFVSPAADGVGAVFDGVRFVAVGKHEVYLIDRYGSLIEKQVWDQGGGDPIEAIGLVNNAGVVLRSAGMLWLADSEILSWKPLASLTAVPSWSAAVDVPPAIHDAITRHYRGGGLSIERVLLDLHSGRIFGDAGIFFYDLLALLVGFLALSGLVLWIRALQKRNGQHSKL